jgi:hypothetical protein
MKKIPAVTIASALLLAAGCAHEERHQAQYDQSIAPSFASDGTREYGGSPSTTYSADVSGSTGMSGNVNGTIGTGGTSGDNGYATSGGYASASRTGSESDNAIVGQVRESLQRDPEIALIVPNVQISANNGAILLNGIVQSDGQRRQIEALAKGVSGVVVVNDQLKVIKDQGSSRSNSQLNPTGSNDTGGSQRLYNNAGNGEENSGNNAVNPVPLPSGGSQIDQQNNQAPSVQEQNINQSNVQLNQTSSSSNSLPRLYKDSANGTDNSTNNVLNSTSRTNGQSQIYKENDHGQNAGQSMNSQSNSVNQLNPTSSTNSNSSRLYKDSSGNGMNKASTNGLNPTSRPEGGNQIYQQNNQLQDTNNISNTNSNQMP